MLLFSLLLSLLSLAAPSAKSQEKSKPETIEATAQGTDTQLGKEFSVTLTISEYSPRADKQILVDAFEHGKDQGLYNALSKMRAVGHIAITGTIGYDVSYIQMTPTPTGARFDLSPTASSASVKCTGTLDQAPTT